MLPALEPAGLLLGRCLLAALFLHEAWAKLMNYDGAMRYTESFGLPGFALVPAIALEAAGGLAILAGFGTRIAALSLAGFCVAAAAIFHTKFGDRNQLLHFEKDLAIAGGFLILVFRGAGPWSLDRVLDAVWSGGHTAPRTMTKGPDT